MPGEKRPHDVPGVIAPPPFIFLIPLAVGVALSILFPVGFLPPGPAYLLGGLLIALWLVLSVSAIVIMRRARTSISTAVPTAALVVSGPFRLTRNPLYLGNTFFYAGIAILTHALWALVLLPAVLVIVQRGVIEREERYLERRFGVAYLQYKRQVRRWL